jgi:uncharacterized protein GlcG (DUF336 family)
MSRAPSAGVLTGVCLLVSCVFAIAAGTSDAQTRRRPLSPGDLPGKRVTAPDCGDAGDLPGSCRDGKPGGVDGEPGSFAPLDADEVMGLAQGATAAIDDPRMTVAVVDRAGRVLAIVRNPDADPANDEVAVGLARTAAFFSHNRAPLSSRTVRFISGVHFPPGVKNAPNAALYGIENTNRGCDFNVTFNPGKCIPRATSVVRQGACDSFDQSGCGPGIVTGKSDSHDGHASGHPAPVGLRGPFNPGGLPVNPGGVPVYRVGSFEITSGSLQAGDAEIRVGGPSYMVGGIGVAGVPPEHAEFAAFAASALGVPGVLFPAPRFPDLPEPGRVIIDGIRLPFVDQAFRPAGTRAGSAASGTFVVGPVAGGCAPNRYLVGPSASPELSVETVDRVVRQSVDVAQRTRGVIRLPLNSYARMVIAVSDLEGNILAIYRMPDATVFSIDVAVAKARNVIYFSREGGADLRGLPPGTAITNRTIGFGAQPLYPIGIDGTEPGPFFDVFLNDLANPCSQGFQAAHRNQNGVVFFPGAVPLYRNGVVVGGLGISGDGVEQDDYVSKLGAGELLPAGPIWSDRIFIRGVRLPFLKYPRQPTGVTENNPEPFDEP